MSRTLNEERMQSAIRAIPPRRPWALCAAVFAIACVARLLYVHYFAVAMPFWDQWDAEGARLLKPWLEDSFGFAQFWSPHNEHRILPTRLTTLASYYLTGQWNNIFEARLNAFLYALIPAALVWNAYRNDAIKGMRWLLLPVVLALAMLPFAWENFLVGFQSQFYFLILFAIVAASLAATRHDNIIAIGAAVLLSIVSSLTMASGLLTPVAVAFTYAIACYLLPGRRWPAMGGVMVLLAVAAFAYTKMPIIPGHGTMRAESLVDLADAASHVLGWPIQGYHWAILLLWLPGAIALLTLLVRRSGSGTDIVMAGLYAWSMMQAMAIAYGRGHGLVELVPRYSELLVPGLFANAWFCLRLQETAGRNLPARALAATVGIAFAATFFGGHAVRAGSDWAQMRARHQATEVQADNVNRYLASSDPVTLDVPHFQIPYPSAQRLRSLLDDPTIRAILPGDLGASKSTIPPAPATTERVPASDR